jgi:uncharacterized protein (TIGR03382 family)
MRTSRNWVAASVRAALSAAIAGAVGMAHALPTLNLTDSTYNNVASQSSGTITNTFGSATFSRDGTQPAGTGVFNPFLRLDCQGNGCDEQGYNTNASQVLDNKSPVNWTHDVKFSDLQTISISNIEYYQFKLDINEPGNDKSLLSLDGLKLFSTSVTSQSSTAVDSKGDAKGIVGTLLWDMDAGVLNENPAVDRSVLLDATLSGGPGSGIADMVMLVGKSQIDALRGAGEDYLILWSRFGLEQGAKADNLDPTEADAGFEEWSFAAKDGVVTNPPSGNEAPTPGTAALAVLALALMGGRRRARPARGAAV